MRDMLAASSARLTAMHTHHVHRDPWPAFAQVDVTGVDPAVRAHAVRQWAGRARNEYGSVHQFSALTHALATARVPVTILGALARLQTDEARHVELCAALARAYAGADDEVLRAWPIPRAPWRDAPRVSSDADVARVHEWAAEVAIAACCIGETLSVPMLEAIALVATEPTAAEVARQILRDEHLHATFGWELLGWLLPQLDEAARARVQANLAPVLGGFEATTCSGITAAELAGTTLEVTAPEPGTSNLGTLDARTYAAIFYATLETEIFPRFVALGLDPLRAWATRSTRTAPK
jgi:hypothetical protein